MNDLWLAPTEVSNEPNCYFRAVKILHDEKPTSIAIAAESYYILYVNGKTVGRGPARGTRRHNYFDTYELAEFICPGKNVIAVLVYCMNIPTFIAVPSQPAFSIRLDGQAQPPPHWQVSTATDWRKDTPICTMQTGFAEWRDLRLEPVGWLLGEGTDQWPVAVAIPAGRAIYSKKLLPRDIPRLRETVFSPVNIPLTAAVPRTDNLDANEIATVLTEEEHFALPPERLKGFNEWMVGDRPEVTLLPGTDGEGIVLLFDFGVEVIGRFELDITGQAGAVIDLCHDEAMVNHRLSAVHGSYNFADRYILRAGRQVIGNTINERGFSMVQAAFRNFNQPLVIHSVRAVKAVYPYLNRGTFRCDDFMLNRLWDACGETLSTCSTDTFIDCPWRERAFWVNDLIVENKTSLEFFGASAIHRHAFRMVFSDARDNGLIPGVCPCPDEHGSLIFPATNLFMPLMLRDYLLYSGDRALITELLPQLFKIFDVFEAWFNADSLLVPPDKLWNFFDWSFGMTDIALNGKNTALLNYLYVLAINTAIELVSLSGTALEVAKYRARAASTAASTNRQFFKTGENRLADWLEPDGSPSIHSSQLAHALALLSGQVPADRRNAIEFALNDHRLLAPELYLSFFVFQAMRRCGQEAAALERIRKYWGPIVASGSPTIWEAGVHGQGKAAFDGNASLCHGFATAPVDFLQTVILGVEPLKPGFAEFRLAPRPCGLKFAHGRIPTPTGNIQVRWEARGNELRVDLNVPPGTQALCDDGRVFAAGQHQLALNTISKTGED
ncbi:MAG: alpha-L-rhamnosidase C-terminal domain-containing protein [bacterium]